MFELVTFRANYDPFSGRRGASCPACGITIMEAHVPGHLAVHRGERPVDERDVGGAYFCDLCGLMFRHHQNLIKHWRTGCPEIQVASGNWCCTLQGKL